MPTQVQIRGNSQATQEARTLAVRELDINTTDTRLAVHDGSTAGGMPHVNARDSQNREFTYVLAVGTNTITAAYAWTALAYVTGMEVTFKAANNNSGSATLNVDSLGAKTLKKVEGGALVVLAANDIIAGVIYTVTYDGTDFIIDTLVGGAGNVPISSIDCVGLTTVDFDGIFVAGNNYRFQFTNLVPNIDIREFRMRTSNDGGSSFLSGASDYRDSTMYSIDGGTPAGYGGLRTSIALSPGSIIGNGDTTADQEGYSGEMLFMNPIQAGNNQPKMRWSSSVQSGNGTHYVISGSGLIEDMPNGRQPDGCQFFFESGIFDAGRISVFEESVT